MEQYYIITIESYDIPIQEYETVDETAQIISRTSKKIIFRSYNYISTYMEKELELLRKISESDDRSLELTVDVYNNNDEKLYMHEYIIINGNVTHYYESESDSDSDEDTDDEEVYEDTDDEEVYEEYNKAESEFINSKGEKCYIIKQWEVDEMDAYIIDLSKGFDEAMRNIYNKNRQIFHYNNKLNDIKSNNEIKGRVISNLNSSLHIYRQEMKNIEEINGRWNNKMYVMNFLLIVSNLYLFYYK